MQDKKQRQQATVHEVHVESAARLKILKQLCGTRSGVVRSAIHLTVPFPGSLADGTVYQSIVCDIKFREADGFFLVSLIPWKTPHKPAGVQFYFTINPNDGNYSAIGSSEFSMPAVGSSLVGLKGRGNIITEAQEEEDGEWHEGQFSPESLEFDQLVSQCDGLLFDVMRGCSRGSTRM